MKLREKFIEPTKIPNIKGIWVEDVEGAEQCEKIADEFAIGFAEWIGVDNGKQLLEIYKKEKGL